MANLLHSYQELINNAPGYTNILKSKTYDPLKCVSFETTSSLSNAQLFYVIDYTHHRYLYIDPSFQNLFGCDQELLPDGGLNYFTALWNKNDFKIFNEKIIPETIHFLKQYAVSDYPCFSFSFNYRVKAKDDKNYTLLQRATYFSNPEDHNLLAAIGTIVNITNYKTDSSIIHTAEKIDRNLPAFSKVSLFIYVYYTF